MSFRDFRAYLAAVGRPRELSEVTADLESWQMYVSDLGGLDSDGNMTAAGMVAYREVVEDEHPLEWDLLTLKRKLLPKDLDDWRRYKEVYDKVDEENVVVENSKIAKRIGRKRAEKELKWGPSGKLSVDYLQQVLADCGEYYNHEHLQVGGTRIRNPQIPLPHFYQPNFI